MRKKNLLKTFWYLLFGILCLAFSAAVFHASAQSFEEFKKTHMQKAEEEGAHSEQEAFNQYRKNVNKEFNQYRQIVAEEFKKYKQQILRNWKRAKVSSKKRWVEYSADYQTRRIVDFEKSYIKLDIITDNNETQTEINRFINEILSDLVIEDQNTAYTRDHLSQKIDDKLQKRAENLKKGPVSHEPILAKVLTGKREPSKNQVKQAVFNLKDKATVSRKPSRLRGKQVISVKTPLPPKSIRKKAIEYKLDIKHYAEKRGLNTALVFAIIHTESAFNPMARSYIPAYGLMQIVPESAGKDASELLFGEPVLLSPSFLYDGKRNINVGTSYLYLLFNRYLEKIKSIESRRYCAIAAYNTGPGNVARAFVGTGNIDKAARKINKMAPNKVYQYLVDNLPYQETKDYLKDVNNRIPMYEAL